MEETIKHCKNCDTQLQGDFCYVCGQKSRVARIDLDYIISELPYSFFQLNKGFLHTIKQLLIRPGHTVREFLEGKRVKIYKPIGFIFILSTLYTFANYVFDTEPYYVSFVAGFEESTLNFQKRRYADIADKFSVYIPLLSLIFTSLSTYLFFIKGKFNLFEHFVINSYVNGIYIFIMLATSPLALFSSDLAQFIGFSIAALLTTWAYVQLFKHENIIKTIILFTLANIMTLLMFSVALDLLIKFKL